MSDFKEFDNPWSADNSEWFGEEKDKWLEGGKYNEWTKSRENTSRKVIVTITDIEDSWGLVKSYPNNNGFKYVVPLFVCLVSGVNEKGENTSYAFRGIRFGVQYDEIKNIGPVVVGLKDEQSYVLKWVYQRNLKEYSWQVTGNWMIHKGSPYPQNPNYAYGALGCIEIVGIGEWGRFNKVILELANASSEEEVATKRLATVVYEEVKVRPQLVKYESDES